MMKTIKPYMSLLLFLCICSSCEKFVDVEAPAHKIVSATVFTSDQTARSAMRGIYNELSGAHFSGGKTSSVNVLAGLSADNLKTTISSYIELKEFYENQILPTNGNNFNLWSSTYNIIYMCNAIIEGLQNSLDVSPEVKDSLIGQAKFIRAFGYFYLVNLYGAVPLITATDYRINAVAPRSSQNEVYDQILMDLEDAIEVLPIDYLQGERIRVNQTAAMALLARVYLYLEDWEQAAYYSTQVINSGKYELLTDLDDVFLANSREAIWQISPIGSGSSLTNTPEGNIFIIDNTPNYFTPVALTESLIAVFGPKDSRALHWIGTFTDGETTYYYPFKYKISYATGADYTEYSMVLRLAEQYLIKSEALAKTGNLAGAITNLDKIRARAGLNLISSIAPGIDQEALLDSIHLEKRREFFTEWGHRWLELKRTETANEVLTIKKPHWQATDQYYPIPEKEIQNNSNLEQNPGY